MSKLQDLMEIEGLTPDDIGESAIFDGVNMGICRNKGCNYTTQVEPDCADGWCEECQTNSVISGARLMGII